MGRDPKTRKRTFLGRSLDTVLLMINLMGLLGLMVAGCSPLVSPAQHPWLVAAGLSFPIWLTVSAAFALWWLFRRPRHLLPTLAAWILCAVPIRTFLPVNLPHDVPTDGIKVLSYNVQGYTPGEDTATYRPLIRYIADSKAHIICLQEAICSSGSPKERFLKENLAPWPHKDTLRLSARNCLAFYSQFPIIDRQFVGTSSKAHGAAIYRILMDKDTMAVINCHFATNAINKQDKRMFKDVVTLPTDRSNKHNIRHLARKVDKAGIQRAILADSLLTILRQMGNQPIILCGDFNDSPISYSHYRLTRLLNDAYTRSGNGLGISYHMSNMYFRLDNILCSSHWTAYGARVDNSIPYSDHYPIYTFLQRNH